MTLNSSRDEKPSNNNEFKQLIPKSTLQDLDAIDSEYKIIEMINHLPPNTWYFRGRFGDNAFISKVYNKELLAPIHQNSYLESELTIANELKSGRLKNENLVLITKLIVNKKNAMIFMEDYRSSALALVMQNGPQSEVICRRMSRQILSAIDYLHSNGISHRNIKLENIYLSDESKGLNAKLGDFTCALKCLKEGKVLLDSSWVGSEEYMSPETLERRPHDPRVSDIWSFGVCLFLLLHNCFPFSSGINIRSDSGRDRMLNKQLTRVYLIPNSIKLSSDCMQMYRNLMTPEFQFRPNARKALKQKWIAN